MKNPNDQLNDKSYFFGFVHKYFLLYFPFLEKIILNPNLDDDIFERAKKLGYVRKEAEKINLKISHEYLNESNHPIDVELLESDLCRMIVAQILQERINNSEVFDEDIQFLDDLLAEHDPVIPDLYLEPIPDDIKIPKYDKDNWMSEISYPLSQKFDNGDWVILYSSKSIHLKHFHEELVEHVKISSTFIPSSKKIDEFSKYGVESFITTPIRKTLNDFQNLPSIVKDSENFSPILIVKKNYWRFHSSNILVRLDQKFMNENNLVWDTKSPLNLLSFGKTVIKYQLWAGPFDGDMHTRHRIAEGVRLLVKKDFLKEYLKKKNISLFKVSETERLIADPGIQKTVIKESKKIKDCEIYSSKNL